MTGALEWVQIVDATEICKGCGKPLGVGWAVQIKDPPSSMTDDERDSLFHSGPCVSDWAKREERQAIERVLVYPENIISRLRGDEMMRLAESAQDWRVSQPNGSIAELPEPSKSSSEKG